MSEAFTTLDLDLVLLWPHSECKCIQVPSMLSIPQGSMMNCAQLPTVGKRSHSSWCSFIYHRAFAYTFIDIKYSSQLQWQALLCRLHRKISSAFVLIIPIFELGGLKELVRLPLISAWVRKQARAREEVASDLGLGRYCSFLQHLQLVTI